MGATATKLPTIGFLGGSTASALTEWTAAFVQRLRADEGGDLFAAHLPEFWQQGDECEGQHGADAWHRGQQLIALSESNIGGNHLGQALVEEANIGLQWRLEHQAHSRSDIRGGCGLPVATRAES